MIFQKFQRRAVLLSFFITTSNAFQSHVFQMHTPNKIKFSSNNKLYMSLEQKEKNLDKEDVKGKTTELLSKTFDPLSLSTTSTELSENSLYSIDEEGAVDEETSDSIGIWTARGLLLLVAILWGTNFASVKYLENLCFHPPCSHPPSEAALARFGVASLVSIPLLINQRKDVILAGFECGMWITLGYFSQAMALSTIPAGTCAFICSLTVVVVPLISAIFFGKEIKPVNMVSAGLALAGVGILEGLVDFQGMFGVAPALADMDVSSALNNVAAGSSSITTANAASAAATAGSFSLDAIKGDLIALGQPFGFGLAFMRIEHYVEKFKEVDNRVLTISAAQCVSVGFLSLLWVLYDYHGIIPNMEYMIEPHRIGAIAWTGIMTTVVAIYFEGIALQKASATEASLTFASEPVWASLFGAWLLHEKLGINSYIGGSVILTACIIGSLADLGAENADEKDLKDEAIDTTFE